MKIKVSITEYVMLNILLDLYEKRLESKFCFYFSRWQRSDCSSTHAQKLFLYQTERNYAVLSLLLIVCELRSTCSL